ncbi:hypothetical protein SAMN04488021_11060 [Paracoccus aminovorans]|uniref:Lipoprotein n=1 Tax=Paracoccus aminovorans TaxID=34004 RepID=A0A1I2ZSH9_9RHOB|nr:hypothetical protein [Paracoccus aminovorans]CQR84100.1 hypothetical protein JCM7685_pAMV3p0155 [Paracoccus aminovorans]SFH40660.1 hypothetical protein SAMN04488021_11060 [Paracoccus aminovorans]
MNRIPLAIACAALAGLTSCGTPTERCEARVSAEQRNVARLLQEVEANIARGYAWETNVAGDTGFRLCAGGFRGGYGRLGLGYSSCYGGPETVRKQVPIDPAAEMRKREALQKRLAALSSQGTSQCIARESGTR